MKIYYFNEVVTLLTQVKEFHIARIRFKNGKEIYVNLKLLTTKETISENITIKT